MRRHCWIFVLLVLVVLPDGLRAQPHAPPARPSRAAAGVPAATAASLRAAVLAPSPLYREFAGHPGPAPASSETPLRAGTFEDRPADPWLGFDKVQHLTFSFLFVLGTQYALVNKAEVSEGDALPASIGVSAALGLAKEYYDWRIGPTRYFSRRDLIADAAGILLATGLILL